MNRFLKITSLGIITGSAIYSVHFLWAIIFAPEWAGMTILFPLYLIYLIVGLCQTLGINTEMMNGIGRMGDTIYTVGMVAIPFIGALLGGCLGFIASFVPIPPKWKSGRCFLFIKNGMSSFKNYFFFLGQIILGIGACFILLFLILYPLSFFGNPDTLVLPKTLGIIIILLSALIIYGSLFRCKRDFHTAFSSLLIVMMNKLCIAITYIVGVIFAFSMILIPLIVFSIYITVTIGYSFN